MRLPGELSCEELSRLNRPALVDRPRRVPPELMEMLSVVSSTFGVGSLGLLRVSAPPEPAVQCLEVHDGRGEGAADFVLLKSRIGRFQKAQVA